MCIRDRYRSVRCHCNVLIWADSETALKGICNDVGSQLALMGCTPHRNLSLIHI